ncbi:MAG: type I phosphomannose isomerase catalytic subunit [Candidatus Korobacteraceae bacterium]
MSALYPFLMLPEFHERVWGALDLRPYFNRGVEAEPVGEVWLTGEACRVANGPLAGQTLRELALSHGTALTGEAAPEAARFPLLIKFLYPRQKLSVQVHPDDEGARRVGAPCGKAECWYVARAVEGAQVGLGLRPGITREMFRMAIEANQAEHMLNWVDVHSGEMIYVDAGTIHAVGANCILVETQQNSDLTYRLYDYGRPRQLHLEEGMAAIREKTSAGWTTPQMNTSQAAPHDACEVLVSSPCFIVERYKIEEPLTLSAAAGDSSVQVLVCLDGGAVVESVGSEPVSFMRGDAVVVPASLPPVILRPQWQAEILRMRLPSQAVEQPDTTLHTGNTHSHS